MAILKGVKWVSPWGNRRPPMSQALIDLLEAYLKAYPFVWLHHLGTVGDERHRKESPDSFHLHEPPDAIDITAIGAFELSKNLESRLIVAQEFAKLGGVCYHAYNEKRGHLHVQVAGKYKGRNHKGEVNKR